MADDDVFYFGIVYDPDHPEKKIPMGFFTSTSPEFPDMDDSSESPEEDEGSTRDLSFAATQRDFFHQMQAFLDILPSTADIIPQFRIAFMKVLVDNEVKPRSIDHTTHDKGEIYSVPRQDMTDITRKTKRRAQQSDVAKIFPNLMLLGIVSQFDAYLGKIIRVAVEIRPDIIFKSQRSFPAYEVFQYSDISSFKEAVVEKEIEAFLRKSHEEQFEWLSSTFDIETKKGLDSWPLFIEACERRNLFAHSEGVVSEQYRIKCRAAGLDDVANKGDKLDVTPGYLYERVGVFLEIGLKLCYVIWRKLSDTSEELRRADRNLNQYAFELIVHEHYGVAIRLLDFACDVVKRHPDTTVYHMMKVNQANAYKLSGNSDMANKILDSVDWSPFDIQYRISVAAVRGDVEEVVRLMGIVGGREDFEKENFRDWPVFAHVRDDKRFIEKYREVYQEEFGSLSEIE